MRRLGLVLLIASVWALGGAESASAWTCPVKDPAAEYPSANAAVVGQVEEARWLSPPPPELTGGLPSSRIAEFRINVLEVHKGRKLLYPSERIRVLGIHYDDRALEPPLPAQPVALLLTTGPSGWGTNSFAPCGNGMSVEQMRALGAANPETPPHDYPPLDPDPPICSCGPFRPFVVRFGPTPRTVRRTLARGIPAGVRCRHDCSYLLRLTLASRAAKRYGLARRRVTVALARGRLAEDTGKRFRLRFRPKPRRALRQAEELELTLTFVVRERRARLSRTVTLTLSGT
jgi:hypothetical protein